MIAYAICRYVVDRRVERGRGVLVNVVDMVTVDGPIVDAGWRLLYSFDADRGAYV